MLKKAADQANGLLVKHPSNGPNSDKHSSGGQLNYERAEVEDLQASDPHAENSLPKETLGDAMISHGAEYRVSISRSSKRSTRLAFWQETASCNLPLNFVFCR